MASSSPDDDFDFDFDDSLFDAAAREILDAGGYDPKMLTGKNGSALIGETFRAFDEAIGSALGSKPDPAVAAALRENAFVFSGFKTHAEMEQVAALITDEKGNIRPFNEFLNDVKQINQEYNHRYLRTEYNQAVQSAQMASKWADFERDKEHINLQYRTANDERVRASHRVLHGVTLPVDDKFWEQYTPPNGWGCRCTVVAVPNDDPDFPVRDAQGSTINGKEVFPTPAYEIFKTNTAKAKKVFPDKHPYLPKGCGNCGKTLLAYNPNSIKCKACSLIKRLLKKEQCKERRRWEKQEAKRQQKVVICKRLDEWGKSLPQTPCGRRLEVDNKGCTLILNRDFIGETIHNNRKKSPLYWSKLSASIRNAENLLKTATYKGMEDGKDHPEYFDIYETEIGDDVIVWQVIKRVQGDFLYSAYIKKKEVQPKKP